MATSIPSLTWTCPQCGQQVPGGQANCPNCARTGTPPPPTSRPSRPRPTPTGGSGLTRNNKITIGMIAGIIALCLTLLLARGCGSPSRKSPIPPKPQAQQQSAASPATEMAKSSPMSKPPVPEQKQISAVPATKSVAKSARAPIAPATANPQGLLVRELKRINSRLEEIDRRIPAEQAGVAVDTLGEIRAILEQERQATSVASPVLQPPRERLSDKDLERHYKEWLISREP